MEPFSIPVQIRWSDLDPNLHIRHSVYYDWGALCRIQFLNDQGLTTELMHQLQFGPILFREECVFRREVRLGDEISMDLKLLRARSDYSRWSIQHQVMKAATVCAVLTVDGAWIHIAQRKLATPPEAVHAVFAKMPRAEGFAWQ